MNQKSLSVNKHELICSILKLHKRSNLRKVQIVLKMFSAAEQGIFVQEKTLFETASMHSSQIKRAGINIK